MLKRRKIQLILVGALLLVGLTVSFLPSDEPCYERRSLSDWLEVVDHQRSSAEEQEAADAIHRIGTNAIPCLLKWIRYEPPVWAEKLLYSNLPDWLMVWIARDKRSELATLAGRGFEVLGPEAEAAIPELTRLMNRPKANVSSMRAISVLSAIGPQAFLPVVFALTNQPWRVLKYGGINSPEWIRDCTSRLGTNARAALPVLLRCLNQGDDWLSVRAAMVLCNLKLEPGVVARSVILSMQHSSAHVRLLAAAVLEAHGTHPPLDPEVPTLLMLLDDSVAAVREGASNKLIKIAPQTLSNVLRAANAPAR